MGMYVEAEREAYGSNHEVDGSAFQGCVGMLELRSESGSDADGQGIQRKAETEMERLQSIDLLQDEWR